MTFRDMITQEAANFSRKAIAFARGRQIIQGDSVEEFTALNDINFSVNQGEILGIIGPNGAGKSTLLKILSRITEPSEGTIRLRGLISSLLEVGTGFHPELTGRENIFLNAAILGMKRAEVRRKFDEIVAFSGVEHFLDTPVKFYSSGMYVRLAFSVAAHLEPDILIIDEVLAVGDHEFQKKCLGKLSSVAREDRTVLFVSHNMMAMRSLCTRAIVLQKGHQTFDGDPDTAIARYIERDLPHANDWSRPNSDKILNIGFEHISVALLGAQPSLKLRCSVRIRCTAQTAASFIAIDVLDRSRTPIMQAIPIERPFLDGQPGLQNLTIEIDLPPLIPGLYNLVFWIGHHYTQTCDFITDALSFEVTHSPSINRSYPHSNPHSIDHGSIVPASRLITE
jgi:lipopolysaccharide transport system ATP-binding protein